MSRIGKMPVKIPSDVDVTIDGASMTVKGPKGTLQRELHQDMRVTIVDNEIMVERPSDDNQHKALHGLTRSLIANMVDGVTKGFEKHLEISGVGYRAALQGTKLVLTVGYSHPVEFEPPEGITFEVPAVTQILIKGIDKEKVGQIAADIRAVRVPDPYQAKGIKYKDEVIRRKAGKTA